MRTVARIRDRILPPLILVSAMIALAAGLYWFITPAPTVLTAQPTSSAAVSPQPVPSTGDVVATRVVIPSLRIDLPIVSGDVRVVDQGPDGYPPCDVALYLPQFRQPGERGTTYLYAHAREGMFLPLLRTAETNGGKGLLGTLVEVYTSDDQRHVYSISKVKRHALDLSLAQDIPARSQRLVLQTSEGPRGTVPKLQILAVPVSTIAASPEEAHPVAKPRGCYAD